MSVLPTAVNPKSADYQENYAANQRLVEEFRARQHGIARGKLLPRPWLLKVVVATERCTHPQ